MTNIGDSAPQEKPARYSTDNKPILLVITPYSPLRRHNHAADDISKPMMIALSGHFDLKIYAPDQEYHEGHGVYYRGTAPEHTLSRFFGFYPSAARKDWSRRNTAEVLKLIRELRPERIHVEYIQPAEVLRHIKSYETSLTLHDISAPIFKRRASASRGITSLYRWTEWVRMAHLESSSLKLVETVFTLSKRDADIISKKARKTVPLGIGINVNPKNWAYDGSSSPVFVFAGAMWRDANQKAATWLIKDVMPLISRELPQAKLRIVGARPPAWLVDMQDSGRVIVTGEVEDIEREYLAASAVLAPSAVDAGVLLKALRALGCGAPLVVNSTVAKPIGISDGKHALVADSAEGFATAAVNLYREPAKSARLGAEGLAFVKSNYTWTNFAKNFTRGGES